MLREAIVSEARKWIGTPYHHQQCIKGVGVDCALLVVGVGSALGLMPMLASSEQRYSRNPSPKNMMRIVEMYLTPSAGIGLGSIVLIAWRNSIPQHMGICSDRQGKFMIHATEQGVCEVSCDTFNIFSVWEFRGV